jgi:hypothetical protein
MLDDHDRQLGLARDRVLHREHRDSLVDHHQLQRKLVDDPRLLAGGDEGADRVDVGRVVVDRALLDAARLDPALEQLRALDVLCGLDGVRRLREDEDLALDRGLELGEPSRDRRRLAQDLDEAQRVVLVPAVSVGRRQPRDRVGDVELELLELAAPLRDELAERFVRRRGGVASRPARA